MAKLFKGVWSHPVRDFAEGRHTVAPMIQRLAKAGFDLLIPCVKGGDGYLSYHSKVGNVHPMFKNWDPLAVMTEQANKEGLKLHPWMCVFPEGQGSALLQKDKTLQAKDRDANPLPWGCPAANEVREYELMLYDEMMDNYDIAGVHLDYIRHHSEIMCFCRRCRSGFQKEAGVDPATIERRHEAWSHWIEWRASWITKFVADLSKTVEKRKKELSAAVFTNYPQCIIDVGQDWADWADKELVDFLFPMTYTNSTLIARRRTRNHHAQIRGACSLWEGLGKSSSASILSTQALIEQTKAVLAEGAAGIVIFHYATLTDEDLVALTNL